MARIRSIKPEFPQSETIGRLSRDARLLFIQLWTIVDDSGKSRASSRMLASLLYPYDDDARDLMDGWLEELEAENCIRRYEVEGSIYLEIVKWLKHQKVDHPGKSKIPPFREDLAKPRETLATDLGPRTIGSKKERTLRVRQSKRKNAGTIPDNWKPDREFAVSHGLSEQRADEEAARFRDHALAKGRTAKNWDAAWRNWVTSPFQKTTGGYGQAPRPGSKEDNRERTTQMLRDLDAYIDAHPDDEEPGGEDRQKNVGLLPFRKPA